MYQTDTQACDLYTQQPMPRGGWVGPAPAIIDAAVARANAGWNSILYPDWRSFVSLGPQAALQAMNPPVTSSAGGGQASTGPGSAAIGGAIPGAGPGAVVQKNGLTLNQNDFLSIFGPYRPFSTFTGPLPPAGTSMSQTYGGSVFNRPSPGPRVISNAAASSNPSNVAASSGSSNPSSSGSGVSTRAMGSCANPAGVASLPWGEPAYASDSAGSVAGGSPSSGWGLAALAALGVLVVLMNEDDKKKRGPRS